MEKRLFLKTGVFGGKTLLEEFDINVRACAVLLDGDGGGIASGFAETKTWRHDADGGKYWAVARYVTSGGKEIVDAMRQQHAVGEGITGG